MRDKKISQYSAFEDEDNVSVPEDELMYLDAGYVNFDDDFQSDDDWGENLEAETGLKFS